ncbi:MAG: NYN domain-containing protein [Pseudomonadota bacterium]
MFASQFSGKLMVYIDGSNLFHGLRERQSNGLSYRIDYKQLINVLVGARDVLRANYYGSYPSSGSQSQFEFFDGLKLSGFEVKTFPLKTPTKPKKLRCLHCKETFDEITCPLCAKKFYDLRPEEKGVDVAIAIDMISHAAKSVYDTAILVGGDKDHLGVVDVVKNEFGKRVEVVNFSYRTSKELMKKADIFIPLEGIMDQIEIKK